MPGDSAVPGHRGLRANVVRKFPNTPLASIDDKRIMQRLLHSLLIDDEICKYLMDFNRIACHLYKIIIDSELEVY